MTTRELQPHEWANFFDCFSRQFHGRRVTLDVVDPDHARTHTLGDQLPLLGITAVPPRGPTESIEVMLGDAPSENVTHVIRQPRRVRVAQLSSGHDDMLLIDSGTGTGPLTRVDLRPGSTPDRVIGLPA